MQQERMSQMMAQIRKLQNKVNSLSDVRELWDPESGSSSGATHVPSQHSTVPSPRTMPRRDSGLPHDTKNFTGTSGNVFERPPAQEERSSTIFNNSKNLASSSPDLILQELERDRRVKWKEDLWTRQSFHHTSQVEVECWITLVELFLTVVWLIIRDFRFRNCTWWNFLTLWNFKAGKSTSRLKFGRKQHILISHCTGSKKLRWQSQLTSLWHRDRLQGETISPTSICLMRWLRLHWKDFSTSTFTFAKE